MTFPSIAEIMDQPIAEGATAEQRADIRRARISAARDMIECLEGRAPHHQRGETMPIMTMPSEIRPREVLAYLEQEEAKDLPTEARYALHALAERALQHEAAVTALARWATTPGTDAPPAAYDATMLLAELQARPTEDVRLAWQRAARVVRMAAAPAVRQSPPDLTYRPSSRLWAYAGLVAVTGMLWGTQGAVGAALGVVLGAALKRP